MTDAEFIAKLTEQRDTSDPHAWLEWNLKHPQWRELSNEQQFRDWFYKVLNDSGISYTDEYYSYFGESEIEKELGQRISWFNTWECFGSVENFTLSDEYDEFPFYAHAFSYGNEKYWVLTLEGQGATSWFMTDEAFKKEYPNYVYCTHRKYFCVDNLDEDGVPMPTCIYSDKCGFHDWEDSRPFRERPYFKEN